MLVDWYGAAALVARATGGMFMLMLVGVSFVLARSDCTRLNFFMLLTELLLTRHMGEVNDCKDCDRGISVPAEWVRNSSSGGGSSTWYIGCGACGGAGGGSWVCGGCLASSGVAATGSTTSHTCSRLGGTALVALRGRNTSPLGK